MLKIATRLELGAPEEEVVLCIPRMDGVRQLVEVTGASPATARAYLRAYGGSAGTCGHVWDSV